MRAKFDPSKRSFLTYSSISALSAVAGFAFVPNTVYAAVCDISTSTDIPTLEDLDKINFYTKSTNALACVGYPKQYFEEAIDEVQYISSVMFNEIIKDVFNEKHRYIAQLLGENMSPNQQVLGMSDKINNVWKIKEKHKSYLTEIMPEFIAQMIQGVYSNKDELAKLSREERKQLNSWDMFGVKSNIENEKETSNFKNLMSDLYSIAVSFASGSLGHRLHRYKMSNPTKWANELYNWYLEEPKLENRIDSMVIGRVDSYSIQQAFQNTMSLVGIIGILSRAGKDKGESGLSSEIIKKFEDTLYNTIALATSMSTRWGDSSQIYAAVNNEELIKETLHTLKTNSNKEIESFWMNFFEKQNEEEFVAKLSSLDWANTSIFSDQSVSMLQKIYPEFKDDITSSTVPVKLRTRRSLADNNLNSLKQTRNPIIKYAQTRLTKRILIGSSTRLAPTAMLNTFLFLFSSAHHMWAITSSDEKPTGFGAKLGIATQMFDTISSIGYYAAVEAISAYMKKMSPASLTKATMYFEKYATFWLGASNAKKLINRPIQNIAHALFNQTIIAKLVTKVSFILSAVGLYYAVDALINSVNSLDISSIVFETLNVAVSTIGVVSGLTALLGLSCAGPLGIVALVAGGAVLLAKILYTLLKPKFNPTPINDFTLQVLKPEDLIYGPKGQFLSIVEDTNGFKYAKRTSFKTLDLVGQNNVNLELKGKINFPRSIVVSNSYENSGKVFSFERSINENYAKASYQYFDKIESLGFSNELPWGGADRDIASVIAAVESTSKYSETNALFLCKLRNGKNAIFLTDGLDRAPTYRDKVSNGIEFDDDIEDIVAISDQRHTVFLVASKRNLYQVNSYYIAKKIKSNVLENNQDLISEIELLSAGDLAHLLIRYNTEDNLESKQAQLYTISCSDPYWSEYYNVNESVCFEIDSTEKILSRSTFYNSTRVNDFLVIGPKTYKRMKARLDKSETMIMSFSSGLELPSIDPIANTLLLKNTYIHK